MIVDKQDFIGEIEINNRTDLGDGEFVDVLIERYESLPLIEMLGYQSAKTILDDLANYDTFINGGEYTEDGELKILTGYKRAATLFVYVKYKEARSTFSTPIGDVSPKAQNAKRIDPSDKIVTAYREYLDILEECKEYAENVLELEVKSHSGSFDYFFGFKQSNGKPNRFGI